MPWYNNSLCSKCVTAFTASRPFGQLVGARLLKRSAVVHITADHYTNFEESWKTSSLFYFQFIDLIFVILENLVNVIK